MKPVKTAILAAALCAVSTGAQAFETRSRAPAETHAFSQSSSSYRQPSVLPPQYVREAQQALADRGLYNGRIDGVWGTRTSEAIREYHKSVGNPVSDTLTTSTLRNLGVQLDDETYNKHRAAEETADRNMRNNEY